MRLSEDAMYTAVANCNPRYDGQFLYGVKTTGIVCRPSCKSKAPNRENVSFFTDLGAAVASGFRPCKRCRPDLGAVYSPEEEIVQKACSIIDSQYAQPEILRELPEQIGLSSSQLRRLFKKQMGQTPQDYLQRVRVMKATELLKVGLDNNTEIGLEVGFTSVSSFYSAFRRETGLSPRQYRQTQKRQECDPGAGI